MHITVVPASPKTGQATIRSLLADARNPTVRGVYRDLAKVPAEFKSHPRFEAVQGSVEEASSLDLSGSDAVLNITPPLYVEERDIVAHARLVSENVKAAVQKAASVKRLVLLSSVGAQYDHGTGEILTNHEAEAVLKDAAPEVVFVRCSYFMENWAPAVETVRDAGFFFTTLTPLDNSLPMIAVRDIGSACASELLGTGTPLPSTPYVFELHGPRACTSVDVQKALEEVSGKSVEIRQIPKAGLAEFYSAVFPPRIAQQFAEMNASYLEGGILYEDPQPTGRIKYGKTELVDVVKEI
ncbi:316bd447-dc06-46fb-ada7-8818c044f9b3 [Thermothielavioides terrestris]|uniref:316bd447-dc06-46fb-ada7-8818c044f9b3 n=1 Tax=Thermothielavioides terrestris TaxID=2587410 RepID=A0A3S4F443_9PEZI|nr:316bd447-dc06-46fb-ada7-8818c044f9b3 [Thermothielavioides terrestris]